MDGLDVPTRASRIAAVAVLVLGPLVQLVSRGPAILGGFEFWFGLYGWLCAAIVMGYVAYCLTWLASPGRRAAG